MDLPTLTNQLGSMYDMAQDELDNKDLVMAHGRMIVEDFENDRLLRGEDFVGMPRMETSLWDGKTREMSEALKILGLESEELPLDGMQFPSTSLQLQATATMYELVSRSADVLQPTTDTFTLVSQADQPYEQTRGFMLCDAVGMGKTCMAMSIFVKDLRDAHAVRPTVILCPSGIAKTVWQVSSLAVTRACHCYGGD